MSEANKIQHGGDHYKTQVIEPWDFIVENNIGYLEGNAIKYLARWRQKGGITDLKKAAHYVQKCIEVAEAEEARARAEDDGPSYAEEEKSEEEKVLTIEKANGPYRCSLCGGVGETPDGVVHAPTCQRRPVPPLVVQRTNPA